MSDPFENTRLTLALAGGLGLIVGGLGNTLAGPTRWRGQLAFALVGVAVAVATAWLFEAELAGWVAGVGVGVLALVTGLRAANAGAGAAKVAAAFRSTRARWAAVTAVGIAGLGYEMARFDSAQDAILESQMAEMAQLTSSTEGVPVAGVRLTTDRGRSVTPLSSSTPRTPEQLRWCESRVLAGLPYYNQLIHRDKPSDACNCHGWVFTGGRYAIGGREVDTILIDNSYTEVAKPGPGDVCVYRNGDGGIAHTALVRAVCDDGTVLVEGKWGWMGVYLHPAQASCYGTNFRYYRTPRPSHVLAGASSDVPQPAVAQPSP